MLHHLDKIYFGSGAMLLFKYPLMKRLAETLRQQIAEEVSADGEQLTPEEIEVLVQSRI